MNKITEALLFAGLIYDEKQFHDKVRRFFPNCQIESFETTTDFYALVKKVTGDLALVIRGTDGTSLKKWVSAWISNFKFKLNSDGMHTDFDKFGNMIADDMIEKIVSVGYKKFKIYGHSRGAALAITAGYSLWKKYGVKFEAIIFGAPPVGNEQWVKDMQCAFNDGCKATYVVNTRDSITVVFRKKNTCFPCGYDIGDRVELPPDSLFQKFFKKIAGAIEHSPKEYADGCMIKYPEDKLILKKIRKLMVN